MKLLYTTKEGGIWKGLDINPPDGDIFAICLPDGTIWDSIIGIDTITSIPKDEFERLAKNG
jgi:hypothetical protein